VLTEHLEDREIYGRKILGRQNIRMRDRRNWLRTAVVLVIPKRQVRPDDGGNNHL
jgi:hypothetical protein